MQHHWAKISIGLAHLMGPLGIGAFFLVAYTAIRRRHTKNLAGKVAYADAVAKEMIEPTTLHPEIDQARCTGCGACVKACPEGEIIQLVDHRAVLTSPSKCVGHGQCEIACPFAAISLVFGTKTRGMELPRISGNFETNVKGLYIAGELGGMGLIRNAIKQGKLAAEHALRALPAAQADVDLLIVGAGSAGLSAALAATSLHKSYICIEQDSMGGTIYNFPRQKIVMTQPAELPIVGTMRFPKNKVSKEELLHYWSAIRARCKLKVREGCKFLSLRETGGVFQVDTSLGPIVARKVILAMGVRGSPRKLNVPGEELPKVTYNLLEPEQYQRCHVAVVGGGNAALEAVQHLCKANLRNKVTLLIRGKAMDRANQENIDLVNALAQQGRVSISYESTVKTVQQHSLTIDVRGKGATLKNNYLFIFAGAELPFAFLKSLGIKIDKKFGEKLRKT